ncbi:MAG: class I SAM-dependent methyltransferase [Planctomycetota bacterium]|nr:class I SAM-dependent methyltransferase [Planctomycetota bacterium]
MSDERATAEAKRESTADPVAGEPATPAPISCVVCSASDSRPVFREFGVDVVRCRKCGHVHSTYRTPQDYDGYFGEDVPRDDQFWWDAAHRRMYEAFARRFLRGRRGRLLDMGCGLGYFVRFAAAIPGWEAHGSEISRAAVDYAADVLGLESIACGRVQDAGFPAHHFDVITLWDVIEHVAAPDPLLGHLATILRDDGFLFFHTPNIQVQLPKARLKRLLFGMRPEKHYLEARDHMNIYAPRTLERVLRRNGFEKVEFVHLPPVQSIAGSRGVLSRAVKNAWYDAARLLHAATLGRVNRDNLFVVARKG